jgi:hypothetical protein
MKTMGWAVALPILLLAFSGPASAQDTSHPSVIDGKSHPELVSDSAAYGLIFQHFAALLTDEKLDPAVKANLFQAINLSPADETVLRTELLNHKGRKDAAIAAHNQRNKDATARGEAVANFLPTHRQIISDTRIDLISKMSADGILKLDAFVQMEKRHMKIPANQ